MISREEAIKLLVNATYSDEWQGNEDLTTAHNMAIKALEPQKGHWIKKEDAFCWWYECDQCGKKPLHNRTNNEDALSDWCPNCGVKMNIRSLWKCYKKYRK